VAAEQRHGETAFRVEHDDGRIGGFTDKQRSHKTRHKPRCRDGNDSRCEGPFPGQPIGGGDRVVWPTDLSKPPCLLQALQQGDGLF
jgi:hypothetical protein